MPVTQSKLQSDLAKVSRESSSEHSTFSTGDQSRIFRTPTPIDKKTEKLVARLNKMNLDDRFDLLKHPLANELVLPDRHVFHGFDGFCHAVANTTDGPQILHTLVNFMKHDVAKSQELEKDKERLKKKPDHSCQELDHTHKCLANSQDEYTAMEKELERVREDLLATQAQLDERSMPGPSQEQEHAQRLELLDELQEVNKKIVIFKKQLAGSSVASVAANPVASYRPRGIGPKNQLTGTDPTAYVP